MSSFLSLLARQFALMVPKFPSLSPLSTFRQLNNFVSLFGLTKQQTLCFGNSRLPLIKMIIKSHLLRSQYIYRIIDLPADPSGTPTSDSYRLSSATQPNKSTKSPLPFLPNSTPSSTNIFLLVFLAISLQIPTLVPLMPAFRCSSS